MDHARLGPYLALMEGLGLELPLLLKTINNILVTPTNLVRQSLINGMLIDVFVVHPRYDFHTLTVQYFLPGFSFKTLRASGTTMRFFLS